MYCAKIGIIHETTKCFFKKVKFDQKNAKL